MFNDDLQETRKLLLKGGVAPRYVKRTISELRNHYADIQQALISEGHTPRQAAVEAATRIGDLYAIARATLARNELKSRISLHPGTTFLLGPVLLFPVVAGLLVLFIVGMLLLFPVPEGNPSPWLIGLSWVLGMFYMYVLPVIIAATLMILARERALTTGLITLSMLVTAFMGSLVYVTVTLPNGLSVPGRVEIMATFAGYVPGGDNFYGSLMFKSLARMALTALMAYVISRVVIGRENAADS